jgi:hypothetical protein
MSDTERLNDVLILQVIEQVEKRTAERETKRFRTLYAMFALVSFVGIGVISQLIELYAAHAVDQRLEQTRLELESAKIFTQLLALATKLDLSDSYSMTDRDSTARLLEIAAPNKKLRAEPAFGSLLEKVIDSFAAAGNDTFVARIFDLYEAECLQIPGITETLMQHYAKRLLSSPGVTSDIFIKDHKRFELLIDAADTFKMKATTGALRSLVAFRMADEKPTPEIRSVLSSYSSFSEGDKRRLIEMIDYFSDPEKLARRLTPENTRTSIVTRAFQAAYSSDLAKLKPRESDDKK